MNDDYASSIQTAEPGSVHEVLWASRIPLNAAAKVGKVHLVTPESYPDTLCGRRIGKPSQQFHPRAGDPRCVRCAEA